MADRTHVVAELRRVFGEGLKGLDERLSADEAPARRPQGDLGDGPPLRAEVLHDAAGAVRKVVDGREDDLTPRERVGLEAIIVLEGRPPLFVQGGAFREPPPEWAVLTTQRDQICRSILRVGRVEVSGHASLDWVGTGFLAGPEAIITNRHVALEFATSDGPAWRFRSAMSARLDFNEEHGALDPMEYEITGIVGVHREHDLAVLRIAKTGGPGPLPDPLAIASAPPGSMNGRPVYVIGYPAWDGRRNDPTYMGQIFQQIYNVKRLQPGLVTGWNPGDLELRHDCSTLGGNSGSPVIDLETHQVVGLHFGGRYLGSNFAVPLWLLTRDPLLQAAGVNFA